MQKKWQVQPAELVWRAEEPFSLRGEDGYYAQGSGLAESEYVFLQHNNLPQAWQDKRQFTVLETGFGTGLNFLLTWQCWLQTAQKDARLNFISVEKYPLTKTDLHKALAAWPTLTHLTQRLLEAYPVLVDGYHTLEFEGVSLILLLGDVREVLPQLQAEVDACYLDGFNPVKNPSMWQQESLALVADKLKVGATFATFTAAGHVRRALQALGFEVKKDKGFAKKREMIYGCLVKKSTPKKSAPWLQSAPKRPQRGRVAVIGAGIAGVAMASELAKRGWSVTLFDAAAEVAAAGSGNPQAVVLPALSAAESLYGRFYRAAFLYTERRLRTLTEHHPEINWRPCGVVQLAFNERLQKRQQALKKQYQSLPELCRGVTAEEIEELSGIGVEWSGLFYPLAGYLDPKALCKALLAEAEPIEVKFNCDIEKIERRGEGWQLHQKSAGQSYSADLLVLASGAQLHHLEQANYLDMTPARGQLTQLSSSEASEKLACVLCHEGYLLPSVGGQHLIGATYDSGSLDLSWSAQDQAKNWASLRRYLPQFADDELEPQAASGRVALRGTTTDQLPLVGGLVNVEQFKRVYADLADGRAADKYPEPPYQTGLYLLAGLGSRGMSSALLSAELLAAQISGEPLPLEQDLVEALNPNRFVVRALKRGMFEGGR